MGIGHSSNPNETMEVDIAMGQFVFSEAQRHALKVPCKSLHKQITCIILFAVVSILLVVVVGVRYAQQNGSRLVKSAICWG
jgi:hypothetical protein